MKTLDEEEELWDSTFLCVKDYMLIELLVAADFLNFNQLKGQDLEQIGKNDAHSGRWFNMTIFDTMLNFIRLFLLFGGPLYDASCCPYASSRPFVSP